MSCEYLKQFVFPKEDLYNFPEEIWKITLHSDRHFVFKRTGSFYVDFISGYIQSEAVKKWLVKFLLIALSRA